MSTPWWKKLLGQGDAAHAKGPSESHDSTHGLSDYPSAAGLDLASETTSSTPDPSPAQNHQTGKRSGFSVYFCSHSLNLADVARSLSDEGLEVTRQPTSVAVRHEDGPEFRINLNTDEYVREEAAELGEEFGHAEALSRCDRRFEVHFDDLEQVLDEMNTLIQVQSDLQNLTAGYAFLAWNCELVPPDDFDV